MQKDSLDLLAEITHEVIRSRDIRSDSRIILTKLKEHLDCLFGFVCLTRTDGGTIEIISAAGLEPANFRRLEARIQMGNLGDLFMGPAAVTVPRSRIESLDFLFDDQDGGGLIVSPLNLSNLVVGSLVLGVDDPESEMAEQETPKLMEIAAGLIVHSLRLENLDREQSRKLAEENSHLKQELREKYDFGNLIGNSSPMRQIYEHVRQVSRSNATVLLRGESGTGKEMIAHAIHYSSLRSKRPFVKVNCAALPDSLIESELFGHEKGAFTGADRMKKGRFELADGGTLFLDEIGDLPPQTQIKLLRVLQEREFERIGGTETIKTNIRLVTATNRDLEKGIAAGTFREDLFYRLNIFTIFLPPLRERRSDIVLLAEHFLEKYEGEHSKRIRRISTPAIDMLTAYHYPGNVRELENAIERAVIVCDSNVIHPHHLPPSLQTAEVSGTETRVTLSSAVASFESGVIQDALKSTHGNVTKAAKMLDSTERILGYKIKKYGIDTIRFRR